MEEDLAAYVERGEQGELLFSSHGKAEDLRYLDSATEVSFIQKSCVCDESKNRAGSVYSLIRCIVPFCSLSLLFFANCSLCICGFFTDCFTVSTNQD